MQGKVKTRRLEVRKTFKLVQKTTANAIYPKEIKASANARGKNSKATSTTSCSAFNITSYYMKSSGMNKNSQLAEGSSKVGTNK